MSIGPYPSFDQELETRLPRPSNTQAFRLGVSVQLEPVVDSEEAAKFLNINPKTLQKLARNSEVPGYRIGKVWKFRLSDLDAWLRSKVISK